jgi:hypothetical protein
VGIKFTGFGNSSGKGCGCCECADVEVHVTGCGTNLVGATVTIKSGATVIDSGTTGAGGLVTLTIPAAGSYTVIASATGWGTNSTTHSFTCGGTFTFALGTPVGTVCCDGCPVPTTLSLTDVNTTISLTHTGASWFGSYDIAVNTRRDVLSGGVCVCTNLTPGTARVCYTLTCSGGLTKMALTRTWNYTTATAGALFCNPRTASVALLDIASWSGSGCSSSFPCFNGTTDPAQRNLGSGNITPTTCIPFAFACSMSDVGSADPAPGAVAISA